MREHVPREQDFQRTGTSSGVQEYPDTPEIPYDVSQACLAQVEWLYTNWWPNRTTSQLPASHAIEQRAIGGDGSYSETRARGGLAFTEAAICDAAKVFLDGLCSRWVGIDVTDPDTVPQPT